MFQVGSIYVIAAVAVIGKSFDNPPAPHHPPSCPEFPSIAGAPDPLLFKSNHDKLLTVYPLGGALFGFDISSMSAIISTQPYLCAFNQRGFDEKGHCLGPTDAVQGGITAAMPGGSWLGSLVSGLTSDRFGRKTSIQIGSVIWSVSLLLLWCYEV
jgi:hypothetical protein